MYCCVSLFVVMVDLIYENSNKMKDLETRLKNQISLKQKQEKLLCEQIENLKNAQKERDKIKEESEQLQSEIDKINQNSKDMTQKMIDKK